MIVNNKKMKAMKKIILISIITFTQKLYSQQQIYPLDTRGVDVPHNSYIKDTKNELIQYVGEWKGTWEGKTLILDLRKIKSLVKLGDKIIYRDEIVGERKVIGSNGVVEIDRISNFDNQHSEFWGVKSKPKSPNVKQLSFYPKDMCNKSASLDIHFLNAEKTKMRLVFHYDPSWNTGDCKHQAYVDKHGDYPMNFPKDIVLTKKVEVHTPIAPQFPQELGGNKK